MGRISITFIVSQALIAQVFSFGLHPMVKQYLQQSGIGVPLPQPIVKTVPTYPSKPAHHPPSFQTLAGLANLLTSGYSNTRPSPNVLTSLPPEFTRAIPPTILADYFNSYSKSPNPTHLQPASSLDSLYSTDGSVDTSLLSSLVLALQIILLSNLLNSSPPETATELTQPSYSYEKSEPVTPMSYAYQQSPATTPPPSQSHPSSPSNTYHSHYDTPSYSMPNANFVGTSSFMDSNPIMSGTPYPSSSRNGLALMSPYEALSPSSPYSDPILSSPYGSVFNSKRDFQSPYSLLTSEVKDVLNFSDFF